MTFPDSWFKSFQKAYLDLYTDSPDIAYLKTVKGKHSPLRLGEMLMGYGTKAIDALSYFHGLDVEALAKQTVDAVIKVGTAVALCNIAVAKMAKTDPAIVKTYKIDYFTTHPNLIMISFQTLENIPVTVTINFVRLVNIVYSCVVNDRFCSLDDLPKKLKKVVFGK